MNLQLDPPRFEKHQDILVDELAQTIKAKLIEAGMDGKPLEELTMSLTFSVATIFDGMTLIESDGTDVHPYLTFQVGDDEIVHLGENSFMHQCVYQAIGKRFGA